jgi:hypothetical protein
MTRLALAAALISSQALAAVEQTKPETEAAMNIFDRIVPFPERLQWLMLKVAIEGDHTAQQIASRLGWPLQKVYQVVWANPGKMKIDTVAEWFFACGGQMPTFEIFLNDRTASLSRSGA